MNHKVWQPSRTINKVAAEAAFLNVNKEAYGAMKQMMRKLGLEVNATFRSLHLAGLRAATLED